MNGDTARRERLDDPLGVRWRPVQHFGVGVLVLAGSSGRVDDRRARLFAEHGSLAESIQWFGGPGQHDRPWEIPVETFLARVEGLARECDRIIVVGTSFGAEAALLTGVHSPVVSAVVALAPSDVVWAGVTPDGRQTSHWTLGSRPLPFVAFDEAWEADTAPPSFRSLYLRSRELDPAAVAAAAIPVEAIASVIVVAGEDDQVWPSDLHADLICRRRADHGLPTTVLTDPEAGHRTILPGEDVVSGGNHMKRGGTEPADRRLGEAAWRAIQSLLHAWA